jgi:Uma2 family endonuclease
MVERTGMTAAEFFQLPDSSQPIELLDGEVIVSPTPVPYHQRLAFKIAKLLDMLIPNGEVFIAPLDVRLDETNVPQPDVMWVAEGSPCVITDKRLEGPPDLVVEVYSPSTAKRDKEDKFALYQRHGVREYWMLDPANRYLEAWTLVEGKYNKLGTFVPGETFDSPVLGGKTVDLTAIFGSTGEA